MKKVHRLVIRGPCYEWLCGTSLGVLNVGDRFCDRVSGKWKKVTCKKCLAMRSKYEKECID